MALPLRWMALVCLAPTGALAQHTQRLSFDASGGDPDNGVYVTGMSGDGRFVVMQGLAGDLVPGDSNGAPDVFLLDRASGATSLVSVTPSGASGNHFSATGDVSEDGRFVAFSSRASDLTAGVAGNEYQIYLRDRQGASTQLVSSGVSAAGGNSTSSFPVISGDGRFVVYQSFASDLVPIDTNGDWDAFLYDATLGSTTALSRGPTGALGTGASYGPSISRDGRFVAFWSLAPDLVVGDLNQSSDVFRFDRIQGALARVSLTSTGAEASLGAFISAGATRTISDDGRRIVFESYSTDMVPGKTTPFNDVFLRDTAAGTTQRVSVGSGGAQGNAHSDAGWISGNGATLAFSSQATNLDPRDTTPVRDVYVHRLDAGTTVLVSVGLSGFAGNQQSHPGPLSRDGSSAVFTSAAGDLVLGDGNPTDDVFERLTAGCGAHSIHCAAKPNALGCTPAITGSGVASASALQGFVVSATQVRNNKVGLLLYSSAGRTAIRFAGGTLCLRAPLRRSPAVLSGGTPLPANDCSGVFSLDVNAFRAGALGGNPAAFLFAIGQVVDCQYWGRDPGFAPPNNVQLTDALEFLVCP